jgi:VanZ family protein
VPRINELLHEARWRRHWQVALLTFAAVSAYFAFTPAGPKLPFSVWDKATHVAAFAAMGLAAALAQPPGWRRAGNAAAVLLGYGGFIELVQSALPNRTAEAADLLADAVGIAGGMLLAAALRRVWRPSALA